MLMFYREDIAKREKEGNVDDMYIEMLHKYLLDYSAGYDANIKDIISTSNLNYNTTYYDELGLASSFSLSTTCSSLLASPSFDCFVSSPSFDCC